MSSPMPPVESTANTPADTPLQVRRLRLLQVVWLVYAAAVGPPVLELDIADDGRGLPPDMRHGLGLLSMQARAADVGGVCRIESIPHGGTSVSVCLPCLAQLED